MQMSARSTLGKGVPSPGRRPGCGSCGLRDGPAGHAGSGEHGGRTPHPPSDSPPPARACRALEIQASGLRVVREAAMVRRGLGRVGMTHAASPQIAWPAGPLGRWVTRALSRAQALPAKYGTYLRCFISNTGAFGQLQKALLKSTQRPALRKTPPIDSVLDLQHHSTLHPALRTSAQISGITPSAQASL
ncbi:hypothetical protein PAL_GLEAN10010296 [Pteropus alecto]|uniref:Uncharacterized protein n=1 Tax=Pteropus alecto TaxID=9402 RepID=L5KZZ9_PTEAL|nr:hypothetical protein PAL_GLEAN10010296 [Pteropus alecto]